MLLLINFLVGILATCYITWVMVDKDGPFNVLYRLRRHIGALQCFVCLSLWVGLTIALIQFIYGKEGVTLLNGIAYAGAATIVWMFLDE